MQQSAAVFFKHHTRRHIIKPLLLIIVILSLPTPSFAGLIAGDLIITEVMANPAAVSDTQGEWFEIFNTTDQILQLDGLIIRDYGSNSHTLNSPTAITVAANDYFVLGRSGNIGSNGGYQADYVYSNFVLSNSEDEIELVFDNKVIDSLLFKNGGNFGTSGISSEMVGGNFELTPKSFSYGDGDIGTPGFAGSTTLTAVPEPATGLLMIGGLMALYLRRTVLA